MKNITLGITDHVDAGKTTLAEAILYATGRLRRPGRVDRGDTAMDSDALERSRGITIFMSQAQFQLGDWSVSLLDTPGHVDFSAEAERTLRVLDCAVLVISGTDGVQAHTETLWKLLERYQVRLVGAKFENEKYFGALSAEYFYHVKNWLGVGAILAYGQCEQDVYLLGDKDGTSKNSYVTLMPAVKFDWLRKKNFGMYSKLAVGATLRNEKFNSDSSSGKDTSDSEVHVNWQASHTVPGVV